MRKLASLAAALSAVAVPAVAAAASAPAAPESSSTAAGIITAVAALVASSVSLVEAVRSRRKARQAAERAGAAEDRAVAAEDRAAQAMAWADRLANAQQDGVVLVLSYPGTISSCRALLEANGWRIAYYQVTAEEIARGAYLPGGQALVEDVRAADAVVVEGLDEDGVRVLAGKRSLRDSIRSGAGVALYTGGRNYRYDLTLWGACDQGVTTPVTTEAAVRASIARRAATARIQGVRPGGLAEARRTLVG